MGDVVDFPALPSHTHHEAASPSADEVNALTAFENFPHAIEMLAQSFLRLHDISPRTTILFSTQQRWLLCHTALAYHFRSARTGQPGITRRGLGHLALQHGIASRNTAYAFFDEALKYDVIQPTNATRTDRMRSAEPSPQTVFLLTQWYITHFHALDLIDEGDRADRFLACPESMLSLLQPEVADALLTSREVRAPGALYTIFTWADAGGLLMDRLITGIDRAALKEEDRLLTDVSAISHLAKSFGLSRAHTSRKLAEAEAIGGIGWTGQRGRSRIWISRSFYKEYAGAQARKLLILDNAFSKATALLAAGSKRHTATSDN